MDGRNLKSYKLSIIVLVFALVAFGAGFYFGRNRTAGTLGSETLRIANPTLASSTIDLGEFWQVWSILDQKFVNAHGTTTPSIQDKLYGAIEGLTAAYGDPYTVFMPPEEAKAFQSDINGSFEGVGMELGMKGNSIVVISPLKNTPAYNAGMKSGDVILSIDGKTTAGMVVDEAVQLIRGKAGTVVDLGVGRTGKNQPVDVKITRGVIDVPTVDTDTKGDVFIIHLYNFYAPAADAFRQALRTFAESGKTKLILDLRGNPGGYLESAVDMASWFLPLGKVVVRENYGPNIPEDVYRSKGYDVFNSNLKMVILVDGGSASAAEILSGALHEQGVATLVGTKTFGKGSVQELLDISPDASLKVTIARWLTPNGISISNNGLTPDYVVNVTDDDLKAGKDPQMDKAIQILDQQ
jgi:carboxyl-terminal processing protease